VRVAKGGRRVKANDEQDPMQAPCNMGFKHRLLSGEVHTFILQFESSHQFLQVTHTPNDMDAVIHAFSRHDEFQTATTFASILVESGRKMRLDYMKNQK
jgi:hypothetical protein